MSENDFQSKLSELIEQIALLPEADRPRLTALAAETRSRHDQMRKTLAELQESLDYLRLSVKYLVFDLEATRRENQHLRSMIDGRRGQAGER